MSTKYIYPHCFSGSLLLELRGVSRGRLRVQRHLQKLSARLGAGSDQVPLRQARRRGHRLGQSLGDRSAGLRLRRDSQHSLHPRHLHSVSLLRATRFHGSPPTSFTPVAILTVDTGGRNFIACTSRSLRDGKIKFARYTRSPPQAGTAVTSVLQ